MPASHRDIQRHFETIPFQPLTLRTRDGKEFLIRDRLSAALSTSGNPRILILDPTDGHSTVALDEVDRVTIAPIQSLLPARWTVADTKPTDLDSLCHQLFNLGKLGWFYRGESRWHETKQSSLGRVIKPDGPNPIGAEMNLMCLFRHGAHAFLTQPDREMVRDDVISWMTLMQHHGAPTRLLDWTHSPWVAAYCASREDRLHNGIVYAFDPRSMATRRPPSWGEFEQLLKDSKTHEALESALRSSSDEIILAFQQIEATQRMVVQQGTFTFGHPAHVDHVSVIGRHVAPGDALVIQVPLGLKQKLMERLHSMNVMAASLFPGLDGVGRTTLDIAKVGIASRPMLG